MTPTLRKHLAQLLEVELVELVIAPSLELAQEHVLEVDRGIGESAIAAIAAQPAGPARDLEAAIWARRAVEADVGAVVVIIPPGWTAAQLDAHERLVSALQRAREAR